MLISANRSELSRVEFSVLETERAKCQRELWTGAARNSAWHKRVKPVTRRKGNRGAPAPPPSSSVVCEIKQQAWLILETVMACQVI